MASRHKETSSSELSTTYDMGNGIKKSIYYHPWEVGRDIDIKGTESLMNANRAVQQEFWHSCGGQLSLERKELIEKVKKKQIEFSLRT